MASVSNYNPSEWEDVPSSGSSNYNPADWEDIPSGSEQPKQRENRIVGMVSDAVENTPIGMAASGADAVSSGFGKLMDATGIPVSPSVSRGAERLFRPARSYGVGVATQMTGQPPMDVTRNTIDAMRPGYQPRNIVEKAGSMMGETAAVVAPSIVSPAIGGPLAMMAQQAQSGKISPLPLAVPSFVGAKKILGKAQRHFVPPLLKGTRGIPEEASLMAIKNPEIWDRPGTSQSVQGRAQDIITGVKDAGKNVRGEFGAAYKQAGMNSPVDEIVAGNPARFAGKGFEQLRGDYHAALSGDLFKTSDVAGSVSNASTNERLGILTDLKRALQNKTVYAPAGQQLSQSEGAQNAAIKQMAAKIDEFRGTLPGGENLALADDAWSEMEGIRESLWRSFKDPYTGQDYLNRIMKGNTDWLTAGRNAGKVGAIQRVEQITGKELLRPALEEMAAAYLKNPRMMGLPSTRISSVISSLVPARFLTNPVPKRILRSVPGVTSGSMGGFSSVVNPLREGIKNGGKNTNGQIQNRQNNSDKNYQSGNLERQNNQASPKRILTERVAKGEPKNIVADFVKKSNEPSRSVFKPKKQLDKEQAKKFLDLANGQKELARALARQAGYQW